MTLLGYFKKYLELEEKQKNFEKFKEKNLLGNEENFIVYLKKWKKAHDSILFRLSNKLYQVFFKDKTQIILCSETRSFIFKNEIGEKKILPISASLKSGDGNEEIIKKIKFVKDLLTAIYTNNIKTIKSNKNKAFESESYFKIEENLLNNVR